MALPDCGHEAVPSGAPAIGEDKRVRLSANDSLLGGRWRRWWVRWFVEGVDHAAIQRHLAEESGWTGRYAFLIVVSAALSLLGLLMPSVAVLIGAMLISPLMMPIIGLGFGIATMDFPEIRRAAIALALGSLIAIVLSVVFVAISPVQTITSEIAGRTRPTLFDLLVAFLSAIAGAYALIRGRGGAVVGVAIAIALMPPLAVVGFGIATRNWTVFAGSLLLYITNAVVIALTAALVARFYGFGSHLSPRHTGWQFALFIVALGALSVPLGAGLKQIAFEAVAQRQVRDTVRAHFPADARISQIEIDYATSPMQVRAVMLTPEIAPGADEELAGALRRRFGRPVDVHVDQLRTALDPGAVEEAQIARAAQAAGLPSPDARERVVNELALIAGAERATIRTDGLARAISASAAPLPGLGLEGYRALEARANRAIRGWTVVLAPPEEVEPPAIAVEEGVVDGLALDVAGWASLRLSRAMAVDGGTEAQREAVARGIAARGGQAQAGEAGGQLRLRWVEEPAGEDEQEAAE